MLLHTLVAKCGHCIYTFTLAFPFTFALSLAFCLKFHVHMCIYSELMFAWSGVSDHWTGISTGSVEWTMEWNMEFLN